MGGSSKSGGSNSGYKAVGKATQAGANSALSGLMDKQSGLMGEILAPMMAMGQSTMDNNPGLKNFMGKVGQTKAGVDDFFTGADSMLAKMDNFFGVEREKPEEEAAAANPNGLTDEQIAQIRRSGWGGYNINTPYSINNDMRNRFNR